MGDLVIQTHDFEQAKKGLKKFSKMKNKDLEIDTVATDGGFMGLGDHKVTGYELNRRLGTIQEHLISLNSTNNKTIREFGNIYKALEALDKDYIQAILVSINATEKTSKRIEATQEQIRMIVEDQKKTLEILKQFKQKLDNYAHLGDIDKIWNDCQKWQSDISSLSCAVSDVVSVSDENAQAISAVNESLEKTENKVAQFSENLEEQIYRIESLISFMGELETMNHLKDVDSMWEALSDVDTSLNNLCNEFSAAVQVAENQQKDINRLLSFLETVSGYEHLKDVDHMWEALSDVDTSLNNLCNEFSVAAQVAENQQKDINRLLSFMGTVSGYEHLKDVDVIWDNVEENSKKLENLIGQNNDLIETVHNNQSSIAELNNFIQNLSSIEHLTDIDFIWEATENHSVQLNDLQRQREELLSSVQQNNQFVAQSLAVEKENTDAALKSFNKKIRNAYLFAGGTMVLALIELVLILLR